MSDETKDKMSLAAAGGFSSLGIVVGVGALWLALAAHLVPGPAPQAVHKRAKIRLTTDSGVCEYKTVGGRGNEVSDKFPLLNKTNGDDIEWTGQDARPGPGHGNPQSVTISFSTSPFTASGPFT